MFIAIEGCAAIGKSTVAKGLAAFRNSAVLLEEFEKNPFLRAFYKDPIGAAIETEFTFLLLHYHQLKKHTCSASEIIADFHLGKDLLYAALSLKDARTNRLFRDLYEFCEERVPRPALLICLSGATDLILRRVRERRRSFEMEIEPGYFDALNAAYERFFNSYPGPKLRVPMDEWDFIKQPSLYARLASLVDSELTK